MRPAKMRHAFLRYACEEFPKMFWQNKLNINQFENQKIQKIQMVLQYIGANKLGATHTLQKQFDK